jgi:hypothetical protein
VLDNKKYLPLVITGLPRYETTSLKLFIDFFFTSEATLTSARWRIRSVVFKIQALEITPFELLSVSVMLYTAWICQVRHPRAVRLLRAQEMLMPLILALANTAHVRQTNTMHINTWVARIAEATLLDFLRN